MVSGALWIRLDSRSNRCFRLQKKTSNPSTIEPLPDITMSIRERGMVEPRKIEVMLTCESLAASTFLLVR